MNKDKEKIYKPCKHEKSCREGNMLICSDCPHGIYDLEKGIDIIEDFIENHLERDKLEINEGRGGFKIGQIYKITELNPALSHLLTEYKNLKQENKELLNEYHKRVQEKNDLEQDFKILQEDISDKKIVYIDTPEFKENYISKNKIRYIFGVKIHNFKYLAETDWSDWLKEADRRIAELLEIILEELLGEKN